MAATRHLFELTLLAGFFGAVYLYGFAFDDYSETELVRLSYVWVAAIVFGTHGLIASEVRAIRASGEAETDLEAITVRRRDTGRSFLSRLASVMIWSYLPVQNLTGSDRPVLLAVTAAALWIAGLALFFEEIFPSL